MSEPAEERHASWLELFFDLVIVVAVAQLAHLLHDGPGRYEAFLFVVLYYAMWSVWTAFTLYANVSGALTRTRAMLMAMFGIAIMAASVPHLENGEPAGFVVAYVACRLLAAGSWKRTSRVMTEWPAVQHGVGIVLWIASLGFEPPVRYWLWAAGVALDVLLSFLQSRNPERLLASEQRELDEERLRHERLRSRTGRDAGPAPLLRAAEPDRPHLGERLGLFVIIVLGEAVAQLVNAAAGVPDWDRALFVTLIAGFGLLVALWWLTLRYGPGAAPTRGTESMSLRYTVPAHYVLTGSVVVLAAGLGGLAGHSGHSLPEATRWVLCTGATLYFFAVAVVGARGGASIQWILGWGLPAVVVPVLLGLFGGHLQAWALPAILLGVAMWHVAYRRGGRAPVGA